MPGARTGFRPNQHGFAFQSNRDLHVELSYSLPHGGLIDLGRAVDGLSAGMCFAALDRFYEVFRLDEGTEDAQPAGKLLAYLSARQLDCLVPGVVVRLIESALLTEEELARKILRSEVPRLRRRLESGQPVVLALTGAGAVRFVVALGYALDPDTDMLKLALYDPARPAEEPALQLARTGRKLDLRLSTGETLRFFFVVDYRKPARPRLVPRPLLVPRAFHPEIRLQWPVDSRRVNQFFGENPESYRPFGLAGHEGLDLFALSGANIYAAASGVVTQSEHPSGHPYGLQVRLKHEVNGKVYHTIYAHLSETRVRVDQRVSAGDLIGLADNTGNSFGSHLHLTLKIDGEQTPGYPAGIVDPWPYLQAPQPEEPTGPLPPPSGVRVFTVSQVNLRANANTGARIIALLPAGEQLEALGESGAVLARIGVEGEWLQAQTASGQAGFVAAWLVQNADQPLAPSDLVIYPFDLVNLRSGPGTGFDLLATLTASDPLSVLGDADVARGKLGRQNEWIPVQAGGGMRGFVAAWLVHVTGQNPPPGGLIVFPTVALNVRARPALDGNVLTVAMPSDRLEVLGEAESGRAKIGQQGLWLQVTTPQGIQGYVAAWLVQSSQAPAPAQPVGELRLFATADLNLRAQASINSPRVGGVFRAQPLKVLEADLQAAKARAGKEGQWVFGEAPDGTRGWAAAWFLSGSAVT